MDDALTVTGYDIDAVADVPILAAVAPTDSVPYDARFIVYVYVTGAVGSFVVIDMTTLPPADIVTGDPHCTDVVVHDMPLTTTVPPTNTGANVILPADDGNDTVYDSNDDENGVDDDIDDTIDVVSALIVDNTILVNANAKYVVASIV